MSSLLIEKTKQNLSFALFCFSLIYDLILLSILLALGLFGYSSNFLRNLLSLSNFKFLSIFLIFKGINFLQSIILPYSRSFFMCVFSIFHLFLNYSMIWSLLLSHLRISKYVGNQGLYEMFEIFLGGGVGFSIFSEYVINIYVCSIRTWKTVCPLICRCRTIYMY